MGAGSTLLNLFDTYPAELLLLCSPRELLDASPPAPPFDERVLPFSGRYSPLLKNRVGRLVNPLVDALNLQLLDALPVPQKKRLEEFDPEVVLVCPITAACLLMGHKLTSYLPCPSLIYFMDDWVSPQSSRWATGSAYGLTYQLLKRAAGWLMISKRLEGILSDRYRLTPKASLIVHNPVDMSGKNVNAEPLQRDAFKVAYAGSVWPMHYDALAIMAEAISQLRADGVNIELVLYTSDAFWDRYKEKWQLWDVRYGSYIPPQDLDRHLKDADLLLVVSSFLPEHAPFTRSSVQTKLTDYMAAGRPILSFGPTYSACNRFIEEWGCGVVCETSRIAEVKEFLLGQMGRRGANQKRAKLAFEVLRNNFEKGSVCSRLHGFIRDVALSHKGYSS